MSKPTPPRSHLQHDADHTKVRKRMPVMAYLALLFFVAFLLILLSYFMQQRANQDAISGLTSSSNSALESIDNLIAKKDELEVQVADQSAQLDALQAELERLKADSSSAANHAKAQADTITALDYLWRLQRASSKSTRDARAILADFQASGLTSALPTQSPTDPEGRSPLEQYEALAKALG